MWREFDLERDFPRDDVRKVTTVESPQSSISARVPNTIQTPVPIHPREYWNKDPVILRRLEGNAPKSGEENRANLIALIRQALVLDAPYLSISQTIELTTSIASEFGCHRSCTPQEIRSSARSFLIARGLLYSSMHAGPLNATSAEPAQVAPASVHVVVAAPVIRADGSVSIFGTISCDHDAISEWCLSKGNVLSNTPLSLGAMLSLGGAESRVIHSQHGSSTVQLELRSGSLGPSTQYTVFLCCRTEKASSIDSVTFCT